MRERTPQGPGDGLLSPPPFKPCLHQTSKGAPAAGPAGAAQLREGRQPAPNLSKEQWKPICNPHPHPVFSSLGPLARILLV